MALRAGLKELRRKAEEKGKSLHFILIIWNMYECEITILIFSDLDTGILVRRKFRVHTSYFRHGRETRYTYRWGELHSSFRKEMI